MLAAVRALKSVPVVDAELRLRPISPLAGTPRRGVHDRRQRRPITSTRTSSACRATSPTVRSCSEDLARTDADVYLVEIKAAAIDVVAEAALERGVQVVFAENEVVSPELDDAVQRLVATGARA